jgi:hypothetical protein
VSVPTGDFLISREGPVSPVLALPSNTTLCGEGAASTLRFPERASASNFWRMLGNGPGGLKNVVIRDLHLDGGNTHVEYKRGAPRALKIGSRGKNKIVGEGTRCGCFSASAVFAACLAVLSLIQ